MNVTDAAQGLGCSSETLRKYERYFELKIERNNENYRNYSNQDMEYFKNILKLKEQGLGLARIKDILDRPVEVQDQKKIKKSGSEKIRLEGLLKVSKKIKSNHMTTDIDHVKQGLELAQINILDRTVEVQDQKIKIIKKNELDKSDLEILIAKLTTDIDHVKQVIKKNELDKIQCSDLEILMAKNISPLRDEMTTGFNNLFEKMNTMIMIQRQEEIIIEEILIEKNQKIEKLEAENQRLRSLGADGGQMVKNRSFLDF